MEWINQCPGCQKESFDDFIETRAQMHPAERTFSFARCNHCELVFLNPRVSPSTLKTYYPPWYLPYRGAAAWSPYEKLVEASFRRVDRKRVALIQKYAASNTSLEILDVGCGKPTFLQELLKAGYYNLTGLDFSQDGWLGEKSLQQGLQLIEGELDALPSDFHPAVVTMWHYLEHDYYPKATLMELAERCRDNAMLFIEVPNFDSLSRRLYGKTWAGYHTPRHTALFSPVSLSRLLKHSGWEPVKVLTHGTLDPYLFFWMSRMEKKEINWSEPMGKRLPGYVLGKIALSPLLWLEKWWSLGFMTLVARKV